MTNKVINVLAVLGLLVVLIVVIDIANKTITGNVVAGNWCNWTDVNHDGIVNETDRDYIFDNININEVMGSCNETNSWCNWTDVNRDGNGSNKDDLAAVDNSIGTSGNCMGSYACDVDEDCPGDSTEVNYCSGSVLYTETRVPKCINHTSSSAYCIPGIIANSSTNCARGCSNNLCNVQATNCTPSWSCGNWSTCLNNRQTKTCTDSNSCGNNTNKPATAQNCTSAPAPRIICSNDSACGAPRAVSICQGNNSCTNSTAFICVSPGTVNSSCRAISALSCDKTCPFGCAGAGVCNAEPAAKSEIGLLEEIILGLNSGMAPPIVANKSAKNFVDCEGADINFDGAVNLSDFQIFKNDFQKNSTEINDTKTDINGDHIVDFNDFVIIKKNYGIRNCNINRPFTYDICVFTLTSLGGILNLDSGQIVSYCESFAG